MAMDSERAEHVLIQLGERLGDDLLLWRGPDMTGSDVDLVVRADAQERLAGSLRAAGLEPCDGGAVWRTPDEGVVIDPLLDSQWPGWYPPLAAVWSRASRPARLPASASPADRLLIYAADAIAGRPLEKLARKARGLLAEPGTEGALMALAAPLGESALARMICDPDALLAAGRRGRLPYWGALRMAVRSRLARRALAARVRAAVRRRARRGLRPGQDISGSTHRRGILIALSGMDGAGKSSAVEVIRDRLQQAGFEVIIQWHRLGEDSEILRRVGQPAKRLLRRTATISDPIVSRSPTETERRQDPRVASGRHSLLSWTWVLFVTALTIRSHRRTRRLVRAGRAVVCDRFTCDSLVELELRYGAHGAAHWLLRRLSPPVDLAIVLEIDPETAALRKPEDQAPSVLERMQFLYARSAREAGAQRVDATRPHQAVLADVLARLEDLPALAEPGGRQAAR